MSDDQPPTLKDRTGMSVFTPDDNGDLRQPPGWEVEVGLTDGGRVAIDAVDSGGRVLVMFRMTPEVALEFAQDIQAAAQDS